MCERLSDAQLDLDVLGVRMTVLGQKLPRLDRVQQAARAAGRRSRGSIRRAAVERDPPSDRVDRVAVWQLETLDHMCKVAVEDQRGSSWLSRILSPTVR